MCGIAGLIGLDTGKARPTLGRMVDRLHHRGPDGHGIWLSYTYSLGLGHTRLAILDTSDAGAQPMHLSDCDLHLVANGEIYNYPDLRSDLEGKYGITCASNCDSEIILHGYAHEGVDFFKRLNGMFAFALVDGAAGVMHLVRDRLGIKPVYTSTRDGVFVFASEIKAVLAAFEVGEWTIDRQGLHEYLCYQTPMAGRTLFEGVNLLRPGHHQVIDLATRSIRQDEAYWSATPNYQDIGFDAARDTTREVFEASVKRHLLSDVPVSATLSSGFDSASVTAQASKILGHGLDAYTGAFGQDGGWYDETRAAAALVDATGGKHHITSIAADDFLTHFDNLIFALDEPRMGMGAFPQYMVARHAAEDFKVILTGHGGDELFSGYPVFKLAMPGGWLRAKKAEIPHLAYFTLSRMRRALSPEYGRHMPVLWDDKTRSQLLGGAAEKPVWHFLQDVQSGSAENVEAIFQTYLNVYLPGLLVVEDKLSMAHAIESRTPILDNAMLDLSLSIPQTVKLHQGELKSLIKSVARDVLPETYFHQPKRGFPTPLRQWLRGSLSAVVEDRLCDPDSPLTRIMNTDCLHQWVDAYQSSWKRHCRPLDEIQSHQIWQLLSLDSWMRGWQERCGVRLV